MNTKTAVRMTVNSSLLSSLTYALDTTLDLELRSGELYRYFAVPPVVVMGLIAAHSKGAYFNQHVRNRFRYQRLH